MPYNVADIIPAKLYDSTKTQIVELTGGTLQRKKVLMWIDVNVVDSEELDSYMIEDALYPIQDDPSHEEVYRICNCIISKDACIAAVVVPDTVSATLVNKLDKLISALACCELTSVYQLITSLSELTKNKISETNLMREHKARRQCVIDPWQML